MVETGDVVHREQTGPHPDTAPCVVDDHGTCTDRRGGIHRRVHEKACVALAHDWAHLNAGAERHARHRTEALARDPDVDARSPRRQRGRIHRVDAGEVADGAKEDVPRLVCVAGHEVVGR